MEALAMSRPLEVVETELQRQPRRWLVTGAAGFIGSHLVGHLLRLGQSVVGLDNFATGKRENLDDLRLEVGDPAWERFTLQEGDIRDFEACLWASRDVNHILHQAAMGSVPRSIEDPRTTCETNAHGFFNMIEAARSAKCESFVYASSSSVYGDHPGLPKREVEIGQPLSPYAATKLANEAYAGAWAKSYGMRVAGLRYFNVVGSRQDPQGPYAAVIPRWISSLACSEEPVIFGDGETSRDFCPVENVVQANLLAALAPGGHRDSVFNIALGERVTLNELFALLRDGMAALGASCSEIEPRYEDFRAGDIRHSLADISRARTQLGYEPVVSLAAGLKRTMAWFFARSEPTAN
jgi:UDP-N-acetylglucosamine 4-epimerase